MAKKTGSSSKLYRIFFKNQVPAGRRQRTQLTDLPSQQPEHQPFEPPAQYGEFQVQQPKQHPEFQVQQPVQQPEYQPAPTVLETEYRPQQQQEVFCKTCGRKSEGSAAFCIGCGSSLL